MVFWARKKPPQPEGGGEPEKVQQDALAGFIDALFEESISRSKPSMEKTAEKIREDEESLSAAFEDFEKSAAKPSTEYWFEERNATMQKGNYLSALRNAVHKRLNRQGNSYNSYLVLASNGEEVINLVMQANFRFKKVMYAYASSLGAVKKRFSDLDRDVKELRRLLELGKEKYERHMELSSLVSRLNEISARRAQLNLELASPDAASQINDDELLSLAEGVRAADADINIVNAEIMALGNELSGYLSPLSRAARKYDHIAHNRVRLEDTITNPESTIRTKEDYANFLRMLDSLEKMLNEGSIDNVGRAAPAIASVRGAHVYELIEKMHALEARRHHLVEKHKSASSLHASASEKKKTAQARTMAKEEAMKSIDAMGAELKEAAAKICSLVQSAYGKRIAIVGF
ncbi:MAG: hypothetical protein LVQ95_04160 [Candidatus Micrarchaeales archaeon]|nr:hypothetical protein [Candidatus Micrarchaeales archaeon]